MWFPGPFFCMCVCGGGKGDLERETETETGRDRQTAEREREREREREGEREREREREGEKSIFVMKSIVYLVRLSRFPKGCCYFYIAVYADLVVDLSSILISMKF